MSVSGCPILIVIAADFDGAERPALARTTMINLDNAGRGQ